MKMMAISALYPPFSIGGAERNAHRIAISFARAGWEVDVATLVPRDDSGPAARACEDGVAVHRVPLENLYWPYAAKHEKPGLLARLAWHVLDTANPLMVRRVVDLAREIRPDVVLTHNLQGFSTAIWKALARRNLKVVHIVHDFALLCPRVTLFRNGRNCAHGDGRCLDCRWLARPRANHAKNVHAVVAVSAAALRIHREHGLFRDVPATVIHNSGPPGVAPRPKPRERDPRAPFVFGFLGRVEQPKGIETLLEALRLLQAEGHRPQLRVAGRGEASYIEGLNKRWPLDDVHYLGFAESSAFLCGLDALVVPSLALEALGSVVFEAYFQGVPVIGSSQGGIPEMIDVGDTGYVFRAGDPVDLSDCMRRLVEHPERVQAMSIAALARARDFVSDVSFHALERFLGGVVAPPS